jgi:hypothetical protein
MKLVKSLMLGSAAGLVVMSGAQAADLPVKAKAVEYVKVCSLYGAGFYYIPGTDTCIKLGGYLRAEMVVNSNSDSGGNFSGASGAANRFTNDYTWRGRSAINIDTRTATEYGVVRTFALTTFSWTTDTYAGNSSAAGSTVYSSIGGTAAPGNASSGAGGSGGVGVQYAYLQFAGFTIGRAVSEFSSPWQNYPANNVDLLVGSASAVIGVSQFTYTGQFGNGVSAAISVQDPSSNFQAGVNNLSATGASFYGTSDYAGTVAPDIIGTATVDQAWGYFKFSVAAHDNHAAYYGLTEDTGHPGDRWGWAAQGALQIKNIPTGPGDDIKIQGVYTDGATRFNIQDLASAFSSAGIYGSTSVPGAYESIGFGTAPDTVFAKGTQQYLIKTWGMNAGFNHNWDPYWSSGLYGAYAGVRYGSGAKNLICNTSGIGFAVAAGAGVTTCNPDYSISQAGIITRWTPVKNLTFSGDLTWSHIDQQYSGTITQSASASIGKPSATYELKSQSNVTLLFRAQRDF